MIVSIRVSNFKSLKDIRFQTAPLTILSGQNGAGKSSLLQAILFASRNVLALRNGRMAELNSEEYAFGLQNDVFYNWAERRESHIDVEDDTGCHVSLHMSSAPDKSDWDTIDMVNRLSDDQFSIWLSRIQYLSANRIPPRTQHLLRRSAVVSSDWGRNGENAVAILSARKDEEVNPLLLHGTEPDTSLQGQIDAWMQDICPGAAIRTELAVDHVDLKVYFGRGQGGRGFRPENVGFGVSIALPVVAMLLSAKKGDCLVIENPEAHLHPRGQASMGRLLAKAANAGIQVFAETHSDHVVNGVRVAVKHGEIRHNLAKVLFFNRETARNGEGLEEQFTTLKTLLIDANGEMNDYPVGFLDEWSDQLTELL